MKSGLRSGLVGDAVEFEVVGDVDGSMAVSNVAGQRYTDDGVIVARLFSGHGKIPKRIVFSQIEAKLESPWGTPINPRGGPQIIKYVLFLFFGVRRTWRNMVQNSMPEVMRSRPQSQRQRPDPGGCARVSWPRSKRVGSG